MLVSCFFFMHVHFASIRTFAWEIVNVNPLLLIMRRIKLIQSGNRQAKFIERYSNEMLKSKMKNETIWWKNALYIFIYLFIQNKGGSGILIRIRKLDNMEKNPSCQEPA